MILIWLLLCVLVAVGAENRNRSGFLWFIFSFFISPIVAGLILILLGRND